ncbi:MAG: hypothetical protein HDR21_00855 [Lachnospiraceae bacterium]|nr:hypothetical protein [Lachnospiraceae bacterium]
MRNVSLTMMVLCLIGVFAGCGNSASEEEFPQNFSDIQSDEFFEGTESAEQADEIQSGAEEDNRLSEDQNESKQIQSESDQIQSEQNEENGLEQKEMSILMKINDEAVTVVWEENESVVALTEILLEQPLSIQMSMYGGFEQVGPFGTNLPRNDKQTTTQAGDIVLYSGNQIVVFYGSNSWAYTRLGKITDKSDMELEELLGNGDVTITLELVS